MIYQLGIFDNIGFYIEQAIRSFFGWISAQLYSFIIYLYNLFMILARADILKSSYIQQIYNRVGMILGLFMIFKLSFTLIQSLVDPEKLTDKKNGFGNIIMRCVVSIVLLGITPSLFKMAFRLQNIIVGTEGSNVIYRLITPDDEIINVDNFGRTLAVDLYFCFFRETYPGELNEGYDYKDLDGNDVVLVQKDYKSIKNNLKDGSIKDFNSMTYYLTLRKNGHYVISWDFLFSPIVAVVVIWILITYCISISVRVFQLAYLQLIAPIPILSYISDPEGTFKNWIKQCTTTYLDLFIRLAIIYFIITLSNLVIEVMNDEEQLLESTGISQSDGTYIWVKIFFLIGLLMFAKRVPDLLKDLFPNLGGGAASLGFGIKSPKNTLADIPLLGGAANKVLGYAGNLGKKAGKFAWNHTGGAAGRAIWNKTGGKVKANYNRWQENRKNAAEVKEMEKPGKHLYNKYGDDITKAFKHDEYKNSYANLKKAKDENRAAEREYEVAKASGDSVRLTNAINRKNAAAKALSEAQKTHDNMRKRYGADARREDAYDMYKSMHSNKFSSSNNLNNNDVEENNNSNNNNSNNNNSNNNNNQRSNPQNQQTSSSSSNRNSSQWDNVRNVESSDDGNPYESGYAQYVDNNNSKQQDNIKSTVDSEDGNPYESGHGQYVDNNSSNGTQDDYDDNPYTNPNYYNDNSTNNSNNNDDDEFDGSNYY